MKRKMALTLLIGATALCGCAHHYVMKLSNGYEIDTKSKPKLKNGTFYYKDGMGRPSAISAGRVLEVQPASMAKEEQQPVKPPKPPKHRHWYLLWLASSQRVGENPHAQCVWTLAAFSDLGADGGAAARRGSIAVGRG